MKKLCKGVCMVLIILIGINTIIYEKVQADNDISIISNTNITQSAAENWARSKGATETFVSLASLYWSYASSSGGVNPAVAYVQAALETGYGKFSGVINESYCNPCGFKVTSGGGDYDPNAHKRFSSWQEGVQAHLDHLALYAAASGYPRSNTCDPRHFSFLYGKATTVIELSNNWAGGEYGNKVLKLYNDLLTYSGMNPADDTNDYVEPIINKEIQVIEEVPVENVVEEEVAVEEPIIEEKLLLAECLSNKKKDICKINFYIDNKLRGMIIYGNSEIYIYNLYPEYKNKDTNFLGMINMNDISSGRKNLKVERVCSDNTVVSNTISVTIDMLLNGEIMYMNNCDNNEVKISFVSLG